MFYSYGFTDYKNKAIMMLLTPYAPFIDPGAEYLRMDAYYICSHIVRRETAELTEILKKKGSDAQPFDEPVFKMLAAKAGVAEIVGVNSLAYTHAHGSRFALSAVEVGNKENAVLREIEAVMEGLGSRRAESGGAAAATNCRKCGRCIKACPVKAVDSDGITAAKCMRAHMRSGDIRDDEISKKMGAAFWGCDICQRVCPLNREEGVPMPEGLKSLLKTDAFLREPEKHTAALAGYIGQNYAKVNRLLPLCLNAAGNSGKHEYAPLITPHLDSKSEAVKRAAERAALKLG